MPQLKLFTALIGILITLAACKPFKSGGQGITGQVTWLEGNQMPILSEREKEPDINPKNTPVQRLIRIYPLVKLHDAKIENGLFQSLSADPIAEVETDSAGRYSLNLSPGRYSVFTVEQGGLFANIFDGEGNIQPVNVKEGEWTLLDIVINYMAYY